MPNCNGVQVSTEFLLMGLISEEPASKTGFYSSGITIDKARAAVEALQERTRQTDGPSLSSPAPELPFSRDAKHVFESAAEVLCFSMWHSFCIPLFPLLAVSSLRSRTTCSYSLSIRRVSKSFEWC